MRRQTDLGDTFDTVARMVRRRQRRALEPFGLTPSEHRALRALSHEQPMRPSDLAEWLRVVPRSATDVVDALERAGLVSRAPDPADRRATLISLTPAGDELSQRIKATRRREADGFFDRLSTADRAALQRILEQLAEHRH